MKEDAKIDHTIVKKKNPPVADLGFLFFFFNQTLVKDL